MLLKYLNLLQIQLLLLLKYKQQNVCPKISSKLSELINIKNVIDNNIISIDININIIFFLFKTNPNIPIKNKNIEKFINLNKFNLIYLYYKLLFYII